MTERSEMVVPFWDNHWSMPTAVARFKVEVRFFSTPNSPVYLASQMPHINVSVFLRWVFNLSQSQADESGIKKGKRNRHRVDLLLRLNRTYSLLGGSILHTRVHRCVSPNLLTCFYPIKNSPATNWGCGWAVKSNLLVSLNLYYHGTNRRIWKRNTHYW